MVKIKSLILLLAASLCIHSIYAADEKYAEDISALLSDIRKQLKSKRDSFALKDYNIGSTITNKQKRATFVNEYFSKENIYRSYTIDSCNIALDKSVKYAVDSTKNEYNYLLLLTTPSDSIFSHNLPTKGQIPIVLLPHYELIDNLKTILSQVNELKTKITNLLKGNNDLKSQEGKKALQTLIEGYLEKWFSLITSYYKLNTRTLSDEQISYIKTELIYPYEKFCNDIY